MIPEGVSITVKVENYEELMRQLDDIKRSAADVVTVLSAMCKLKSWGGYCPHCGKKIINEEENT